MKFFVYGTLKVGGYFAENFDSVRKTVDKAVLKGYDMYGIGHTGHAAYPGIVPGDGEVHGEVHTFDEKHQKAVLSAIDGIEGYHAADEKGSLYLRKKVPVQLEDGTEEEAFVYIFNNGIQKYYGKIEDGVWDVRS